MKFTLSFLLLLIPTLQAATIAVIDRGIDYQHPLLASKMWSNPIATSTGEFPRVINGWNFAQKDNNVFDSSVLSTFPKDIYKLFHIYADKYVQTDEDSLFMEKVNEDFMVNFYDFGQYAHGTHVAGILAKDSNHKLMSLVFNESYSTPIRFEIESEDYASENLFLEELIVRFMKSEIDTLSSMTRFLSNYPVDIANISMGFSLNDVRSMTDKNFKVVYGRVPQEEESDKGALFALNILQVAYEKLMSVHSDTLFVFAAGNGRSDNDIFQFSPANTSASNAIAVAATKGNNSLSSSSNFGLSTVDVAAPGVDIYSQAPGTDSIPMSGTSMAAPFVSRIAGKIKDLNIKLTPLQIKRILMETVDKKTFLTDRVKSGGIVNEIRSLKAAELSLKFNLDRSISEANAEFPQTVAL